MKDHKSGFSIKFFSDRFDQRPQESQSISYSDEKDYGRRRFRKRIT